MRSFSKPKMKLTPMPTSPFATLLACAWPLRVYCVSFIFGFENERINGFTMVHAGAPCEGTGYEIGGIALVKGSRNREAAKKYYDFLMSPAGQSLGAKANSLQVPANKTFKVDPRVPSIENVRLIKYDFQKYGKATERKRLID